MDIKKFWQIIEKANKNTNHDITLVNENVFEQLVQLENPDSLVAHDFVDDGTLFNTAFLHVAEYAYLQKNGVTEKKFDDLVANTIISGTLKKEIFDSIEFSYKMDKEWEDDESSLMKLCPKLFAEFW